MTIHNRSTQQALRAVNWPLRLTRWGMLAERITRAFWPVWSLLFVALGAVMLGLQDDLSLEVAWVALMVFGLCGLAFIYRGLRQFHWPTRGEAQMRLDATLPGRPISTLQDSQAIGAGDPASEAIWAVHRARMMVRLQDAKPVQPNLRMAKRDPYALRYMALLVLMVGVLFGSFLRVGDLQDLAVDGGQEALATGPSWEGWIEPPTYMGLPGLYLNDIDPGALNIQQGSILTIRLYGEVGALTVAETVSGNVDAIQSAAEPSQEFTVTQSGTLSIDGDGGAAWQIMMIPDAAPSVILSATEETTLSGDLRQPFYTRDDFGVVRGRAELALNSDLLDRRHGLQIDPELREPIALDLPLTISGDRAGFEETLVENFAEHPWAGLPVTLTLTVEDALGQTGDSAVSTLLLPGKRFFDPLAAALIEQRRDLLWNKDNGARVVQVLKAITFAPEGLFDRDTDYLKLRVMMRRLEASVETGLTATQRDQYAQVLWDIALLVEDGDLSDALQQLRRAQDKLAQAMRDGASDEEIAELMQELREAMQDYMQQLAQNPPDSDEQQQAQNQERQEITGDQLQQMLDRIQELMEQGRMAEAEELLNQLREMMENMEVTQGGQGQQSPGQDAMEGLADTLRDQQGLSDDAFRDLQEQFNPNAQSGNRPGGESGQGQGQEGQDGEGQGQTGQGESSLAGRQQALRDELGRQQQNLPGAGTPEGDAARESLGRAGEAMEGAEEALRQGDNAEALDRQADAMEALREGMRNLGEAMAQQQQEGQQGESVGEANPNGRDPLGRDSGTQGNIGSDENLLQGEDVYRRAKDLLDEIRRKSGERDRPAFELDYLKRLLDRF
ncbi:MAG: TIGR02302 family protein [Pseudoruegeria sp.]